MLRGREWGRCIAAAAALCVSIVALVVSMAAAAACPLGTTSCVSPFNLEVDVTAKIDPGKLSRGKPDPVSMRGTFSAGTRDGTHPSSLREAVLTIDKDLEIDVTGLPVCGYRATVRRNIEQIRRLCRKAIVGKGEATIDVAYPENTPITLASEITLINGGERAGETTLLAHAFIPIPVPRSIVVAVKINRKVSGLTATAKIPRMTDGYGSLTEVSLRLGREFVYRGKRKSFLSARCPDGVFKAGTPLLLFRNEAHIPGVAAQTALKGGLAVPCRPMG